MTIDSLAHVINFLAEMPKSGDSRMHAENYIEDEQQDIFDYTQSKNDLKNHEGFRPKAYADSLGKPTIGYGHLITDGRYPEQYEVDDKGKLTDAAQRKFDRDFRNYPRMSKQEAEELFEKDWKVHHDGIKTKFNSLREHPNELTWHELPQSAREVMLNVNFTMGADKYSNKFTQHFKAMRNGNFHLAGLELLYKDGLRTYTGQGTGPYSDWFIQQAGLKSKEFGGKYEMTRGLSQVNKLVKTKFDNPLPTDETRKKEKQGKILQEELNNGR